MVSNFSHERPHLVSPTWLLKSIVVRPVLMRYQALVFPLF